MSDDFHQVFESTVWFTCPHCGESVSTKVTVPVPNFSAAEELGDLGSEGESEIECPSCQNILNCYIFFTHGDCSVTLSDFADRHVSADTPYYSQDPSETWTHWGIATEPYEVFLESDAQVTEMLNQFSDKDGHSLINRMLFSQSIGSLEAYLADALIAKVLSSPDALKALVEGDRELMKQNVSLADAIEGVSSVEAVVTRYLQKLIYHNLPKINALYKLALSIEFMKDIGRNDTLLKAIQYRHDCVHRNGRTIAGDILGVFTPAYVSEVTKCIREMVEEVDAQVTYGAGTYVKDADF